MSGNADLTAIIDGDTKGLLQALAGATGEMKGYRREHRCIAEAS
jgi:hypothetical protein